ncbi:hypothetical protein [Microbacterium maritypicum]|uniref:Uncharacterized protein n=2 Tax=Microbacterium maritypicum TaxID=33918 RepID=A0ACD4B8L3_MICMQ|nr:hypothetical protein [Microbacterium liquefaciens]MBP5800607.1 hypothetical protein [Microbacterium liquefaciens]UTT53630.1 hypothetical protein NMQ05_03370 [Microbacterium liquefaciens]WEF21747.1 hypothetical protein PWF71_03475 [Microbacterium liquefaciens]
MTLTEILPTLRRSIPTPLDRWRWPTHSEPTTTDVVVGGISLMRLFEISGSPAVLTGDLPIRGMGTDVTVLLFRITLRVDTQEDKRIALTDCSLDGVDAAWEECRLIGRASSAKTTSIELIPGEQGGVAWPHPVAALPSDLREGDLLVVPCIGAVTLRSVRPRAGGAAALQVEASR